jgi:hypothetical protein
MAVAALRQLVDQYEGTNVSHLFWNVNYQRAAYRSKVWPSYWDVPAPETELTAWARKYYELHRLGIDDVFAIVIPRCRERGISPWISLRMNDHHYRDNPLSVSPFMVEHPELRLAGGKGLFNYAKPEVRRHYLALIGEVLGRYDVDGLELDWMRSAPIFEEEETASGRPVISEFMRQVRAMAAAAGERLGHPVRIAARVSATPELAYGLGFDAVEWAKQGLIDILIPGASGYPDVPVERWRTEIGTAGKACLIMPGTDRAYSCVPGGPGRGLSRETTRGFTASMLDRGADGLYLFNHFMSVDFSLRRMTPEGQKKQELMGEILRDAGDLASATAKSRLHVLTLINASTHKPLSRTEGPGLSMPFPVLPQKPLLLRIHTGPKPVIGRYLVRVGLAKSDDLADTRLTARLNSTPCRMLGDLPQPAKPDTGRDSIQRFLQFEAPLNSVLRGYNDIELGIEKGGPQTVVWLEVLIEPKTSEQGWADR